MSAIALRRRQAWVAKYPMYLAYFNLRGGRDEVLIHWDLFSCWEMGLATQGINNAWLFFGSQGGWRVFLICRLLVRGWFLAVE